MAKGLEGLGVIIWMCSVMFIKIFPFFLAYFSKKDETILQPFQFQLERGTIKIAVSRRSGGTGVIIWMCSVTSMIIFLFCFAYFCEKYEKQNLVILSVSNRAGI